VNFFEDFRSCQEYEAEEYVSQEVPVMTFFQWKAMLGSWPDETILVLL